MLWKVRNLFRSYRQGFRARKLQGRTSTLRRRPAVEALEERYLLTTTLLWIGPAPNRLPNWSIKENWADPNGNPAVPSTGDILRFDPNQKIGDKQGADTNSTDDMADFSPSTLTVATGFSQAITLNQDLHVTSNLNMATIKGTVNVGNSHLTVGTTDPASLNWSGGTFSGSGPAGMVIAGQKTTVSIGGDTNKTVDGTLFANNYTATWTGAGNLNLNNGAKFNDNGSFAANASGEVRGTGTFSVNGTLSSSPA
jgi:hypothetical protein